MGWKSWLARGAGYGLAPWTGGASIAIGEGIAQGLGNKEAIDKAEGTQQAATDKALALQQQAQQTAGDIYQQQRADTQNLFGQGYQTLGGLMGMNIAPIGPASNVQTTPQPAGTVAPGLVNNAVRNVPPGMSLGKAQPRTDGLTLAQLQRIAKQNQSTSSYARSAGVA